MIQELRAAKSAHFYKARNISKSAIAALFRELRSGQRAPSQNLFHLVREVHGSATCSAVCFMYERAPAFLAETSAVRDKVCGFLLLVEYGGYVGVFKSQLDLTAHFIAEHLDRVSVEQVDGAVTGVESTFERIRLRNMTLSRLAMRAKTLEAANLENVVGPAGAGRYAPLGYTVRTESELYSATPNTGRIAQRSDRVDHTALVDFATFVIDGLATTSAPASFIHTFARSLKLSDIATSARPVLLAIDVAKLTDALYEEASIRLVREESSGWAELGKAAADDVLSELDQTFSLEGAGRLLEIVQPIDGSKIGSVSVNKSRVSLRSLDAPLSSSIQVEHVGQPVGADPERLTLRQYLDQHDAIIVLFDRPELAYISGSLYRDEAFVRGGELLLRYLKTDPMLQNVLSEKGNFGANQTDFDVTSTFGTIVQSIARGDNVLVCDDLGDEWADFIGINTTSTPPTVTFYHAKHGPLSLGASPFHISVSQAIKNLGRIGLVSDRLPNKVASWQGTYNNETVRTSIRRVSRGDPNRLETVFRAIGAAPDTFRRVAIVTSSLSKAAVERAFSDIQGGQRADPHFVQLYWLLMSYISACAEVGAYGYIVCQE